jgi:uncharacterized protein
MSELKILVAARGSGDLPEMAIDPSWIIEGLPRAQGKVLVQSADKKVSTGLWECSAGRFKWTFVWDEFVHILEGEVTIKQESGPTVTLRPGDTAHFPLGLKTEWLVPHHVRKVFTVRTAEPLVL